MAIDILESVENWGKANTAFQMALRAANTARQSVFADLGVDLMRDASGKIMKPENAVKVFTGQDPKTARKVSMRIGFGEGALPTIAKEAAGEAYQATQALAERGMDAAGGLVGTARTLVTDAQKIGQQKAIEAATTQLADINQSVIEAKSQVEQAKAAERAAKGIKTKVAKKRAGKRAGRRG